MNLIKGFSFFGLCFSFIVIALGAWTRLVDAGLGCPDWPGCYGFVVFPTSEVDIAENKGPKKSLIILGYAGWGSGQLEGEMERDHWILSDIDLNITFDKDPNTKWNKALKNSFIKI